MRRVVIVLAWCAVGLVLLGGSAAGACKLAFDCGLDRVGLAAPSDPDVLPITGGGATLPAGWTEKAIVTGLSKPSDFAFLPDGRVMFTEKDGLVKIAESGGPATVVLDLTRQVSTNDIRGLLTVSLDPGFPDTPYVYVLYTGAVPGNGMTPTTTYLSRFTWTGESLDPASERKLLETPQQDAHAGGQIVFAPDGTVFVSTGDAARTDAKEPYSLRAQDLDAPQGKILHITLDGQGVPSNPFWSGDADASRSKVWAYGFRNPFRMTFLPGSSTPIVGDVGYLQRDEINVIAMGANYGWPCYEGNVRGPFEFPATSTCKSLYAQGASATKRAIVVVDHAEGASITGGAFYAGDAYPEQYRGAYFYADFPYGWLRYLKLDENAELVGTPVDFGSKLPGPVAIHNGPGGRLYYLSLTTGELRRLDEPT